MAFHQTGCGIGRGDATSERARGETVGECTRSGRGGGARSSEELHRKTDPREKLDNYS